MIVSTMIVIVVGVTKMGNILSSVGIEPIFLAFWASVLPLYHINSLMSRPPVYVAICLRGKCRHYLVYCHLRTMLMTGDAAIAAPHRY